MPSRTIAETIEKLPSPRQHDIIHAPRYIPGEMTGSRVGLAVESMKRHMTDEGWQIFEGLQHANYRIAGYNLPPFNSTNVPTILRECSPVSTVVVQDEREWDVEANNFRCKMARFEGVTTLRDRPDIFTLTILKDSHQRPDYHRHSAVKMGCHAWIIYYHPTIVHHLAPWTRPEHLIRTYHSIDPLLVPPFLPKSERGGSILSGATSRAYPLRTQLLSQRHLLPTTHLAPHPGYHMNGCCTPAYLQLLNKYKVAICTSSIYGYALRKIIEATACGCIVLTDLPSDEVLPGIDDNLVRITPDFATRRVGGILKELYDLYDEDKQLRFANIAKDHYDYQKVALRLATDIERMRKTYRVN